MEAFARVTGDSNPLHLDAEYASATPFKKPIMHGMMGAGIFSRIFGVQFPGNGSVYMGQTIDFKRPMYTGVVYEVIITVKSIDAGKYTAVFSTEIFDKTTGKICTTGEAKIMNKEKIGWCTCLKEYPVPLFWLLTYIL